MLLLIGKGGEGKSRIGIDVYKRQPLFSRYAFVRTMLLLWQLHRVRLPQRPLPRRKWPCRSVLPAWYWMQQKLPHPVRYGYVRSWSYPFLSKGGACIACGRLFLRGRSEPSKIHTSQSEQSVVEYPSCAIGGEEYCFIRRKNPLF